MVLEKFPGLLIHQQLQKYPGSGFTSNGYKPEGYDRWIMFNAVDVDYDYIATMGLQVLEGRAFSPEYPSDRGCFPDK